MNNKRLLFLSMVALTLSIGVIIGTLVSGGAKATSEQKPAVLTIPDPVALSSGFSQIAAQLEPAVVNISVTFAPTPQQNRRGQQRVQPQLPGLIPPDLFNFGLPDEDPRERSGGATGTGFIVDKGGYIITNHPVVDKASKITVALADKNEYTAKLVGSDEATDVAVIKIEAGRDLATAKFGNSDAVRTGDWVLAIGSPFGFDHTVTSGIISAKDRSNGEFGVKTQFRGLQRFLQTDAAINPGNSGGPLVNMAGEVIGVNTAIVSETNSFAGLGFALPSNTAVKVYNQLAQNGKVTRGSIGISYDSKTDQTTLNAYGVKSGEAIIVKEVYPGSPALKAGLQAHDVITEINGKKLDSGNQLQDIIADSPVGSSVRIGFMRDGRAQSVGVTIGDRTAVLSEDAVAADVQERAVPRNGNSPGAQSRLGIEVQGITSQLSRQFDLENGVMISSVGPDSAADDAGLERGMVIVGMVSGGRHTVINDMADFRRVEGQLRLGMDLVLEVRVSQNQYRGSISFPLKVR